MQAELGASQAGGRSAQARLRGLEEQLLAAQGECSKLNSQVGGRAWVWAGGALAAHPCTHSGCQWLPECCPLAHVVPTRALQPPPTLPPAPPQVEKLERKAAGYRSELGSLRSMHDALQSEHTAVCGQLTAAQQQQETALDRLQRLAERLALTQQEKVGWVVG